jgi:hypothetical protein
MKKSQVPQDDSFLEGHQKAAYAVDEYGRYAIVPSRGWEPERVATSVALEAQDRALRQVWEQVASRRRSPLAYYMTLRQLTPALLGQYAGVSRWRVWWHLRPGGFRGMPPELKRRYSACLDVPFDRMSTLPEQPETLADV